MKHCSKCNTDKPLTEFNRNNRRGREGYQSCCRSCQNARDLGDYYNRPGRKKAVREAARRNSQATLAWYRELKESASCTDCKLHWPYYVMHYDHIGTDKIANVSTMAKHNLARDRILAEIAKCELVCANCHAIRTHRRHQERPNL